MLRIKNEKGITLMILVITIIVLLILASISINLGDDSIDSTKDRKLQAELEIVQQACVTEYTKAKKLGYLDNTTETPANFIGEQVNVSEIQTIYDNWVLSEEPTEYYKKYYRLEPENLKLLGLENSKSTYIVNYYTGEVFNETKKTSEDLPLYIKSVTTHKTEDSIDNTSFVDENTWYTE